MKTPARDFVIESASMCLFRFTVNISQIKMTCPRRLQNEKRSYHIKRVVTGSGTINAI